MSKFVELSLDRGVARLTLNRPDKRNAPRREMIQDMLNHVKNLATQDPVRVLVLAANGDVFCAGMDLDQMRERATSNSAAAEYQQDAEVYCDLVTAIFELPVPTIAVVQGPVLAGGMGLVCACDIVVAVESAFFMLPEPLRGITAAMVTPLLVHRVGPGSASYMLLSNEKVSALDARRAGLCHEVVSSIDLLPRIEELTRSVRGGSKSALAITKRHIADCLPVPVVPLVRRSINVSAQARETADAREGMAAFLEKRKPAWQEQ